MSLVVASDLAVSYGARDVFAGVTVEVPHRARIALIGPNGSGKTSLLRVLGGLDGPSDGTVRRARALRVGYLPQVPSLAGGGSLGELLRSAFADLDADAAALADLERRIAAGDLDQAERADLLARYDRLQEAFAAAGGYEIDQRIDRVMTGLGFGPSDRDRPIEQLSGGQQTRALLGRLLLDSPDLLLLDEPTNHLDVHAIEWLESYLGEWEGALVAVAHDRAFLDNVADRVWELADGRLTLFSGNYTQYAAQRTERDALQEAAHRRQQAEIARLDDYVRRNIAGQNTRQAQSRRKVLGRMERIERPTHASSVPGLRLSSGRRGGDMVLVLRDLDVGYVPGRPLFHCEDARLLWRQRIALLGSNGSGKTTLLKTVLGQVPPLAGEARVGGGIRIGYLSQEHDVVEPGRTVLEHILDRAGPDIPSARSYLGRYRFSGDEALKDAGSLSGGERARLALALLELDGANFLVLDEPTNHLDIASQEALQEALASFDGSVLLVTHDRYLVRALRGRVWAIDDGELRSFDEGFDEYLAWRQSGAGLAPGDGKTERRHAYAAAKREVRRAETEARRDRERRAELESEVASLEARVAELEGELARASQAQDVEAVVRLAREHQAVSERLEAALEQWLEWEGRGPEELRAVGPTA